MTNGVFYYQLLGVVGAGGFIGEFYRSSTLEAVSARTFLASVLAGIFLSYLVALAFYAVSRQREVTLILAGLLSYQDEKFLSRCGRRLLAEIMEGGGNSHGSH